MPGDADIAWASRRAGRGVDANNPRHRNSGMSPQGRMFQLAVTQLFFCRKGELCHVFKRANIFGMHARLVEFMAIKGGILIVARPLLAQLPLLHLLGLLEPHGSGTSVY